MRAGINVARLNFSHGTHEDEAKLIERIRAVSVEEKHPICILGDLQGPKIRTGRLKYRTAVAIKTGSKVTITPRDVPGTTTVISTTFQTLAQEVAPGARILLSDGLIELRVKSIKGDDVECEVLNGGMLGEHKGINLPDSNVNVPSITERNGNACNWRLKMTWITWPFPSCTADDSGPAARITCATRSAILADRENREGGGAGPD